jgi:hypothetical protein
MGITRLSMTISDIPLLVKKILIGVIVTMIPFLILFGGLRLTQKILSKKPISVNTQHKP